MTFPILPEMFILQPFFLSANLETSSSYASMVSTPAFGAKLSHDESLDGFLWFDVVALQHPSELLMMLSVASIASTVFEGVPV
jgi:hypothetical protein